jgi:glucan phosphoethanolaminetransferase (alkaline phosphatase superfamily)
MHEHCEHCGQAFEPEPGFYQGAMYVSYGLSLGVSFVMGILLMFVFDVNLWIASLVFTLFLLGLLPVIFRVSRVIWLNLFVSYRPLDSEKTPLA